MNASISAVEQRLHSRLQKNGAQGFAAMDMMRRNAACRPAEHPGLPHEVAVLLPREREIATIVYELGAATAVRVEASLSEPLSNAAVRSMLNRLVAKGILKRTLSGAAFVYLPALTRTDSRMLALQRFAEDHFAGSAERAAATIKQLLETRH
jgi:predicted transcriptional regulator